MADRLAQKLNDELMSSPTTIKTNWSVGIQFLDDEKNEPIELNIDEKGVPTYIYSIPYIKKCGNIRRVTNCISLFGWLNNHRMLNLINKRSEVDTMETLLIDKGKDAYPTYMVFSQKNRLSLYQLYGYRNALNTINSSYEGELKQFYEQYLKDSNIYMAVVPDKGYYLAEDVCRLRVVLRSYRCRCVLLPLLCNSFTDKVQEVYIPSYIF